MTFIAGFPQTDFDTKLVNSFLKLVLPVILKELQSNFLISTLGEFEIVMQTRDEVEGLHNCREFSQRLECLYQAMQTRKTFSIAFIK